MCYIYIYIYLTVEKGEVGSPMISKIGHKNYIIGITTEIHGSYVRFVKAQFGIQLIGYMLFELDQERNKKQFGLGSCSYSNFFAQ